MSSIRWLVVVATIPLALACTSQTVVPLPAASTGHPAPWDPETPYEPGVTPADLSSTVTNLLLPAPVGARWVYEESTPDGVERIEVTIEEGTRDVWGVAATVRRDTLYLEGEMMEDARDWLAQDGNGNVWYLGGDAYEYENGELVCECGGWEAGVDGALPGIVMLGEPRVGLGYRQAYWEGEVEDLAEVVALDVSVTVAAGTFTGCTRTREVAALERDVEELKTSCPGVGIVLAEVPQEGGRVELVEYTGL